MIKFLMLIQVFTLISFEIFANEIQGKVIKVTDGDTITVLTGDNQTHKIRLSGIDAPEKSQAFGNKSKIALTDEIYGKTVTVEFNKRDKYQRIVGKVMFNGKDVNLNQIKRGLAWHYKKYESEQDVEDRSIYANAEYLAQRDRVGLWAENNPVAPWDFRKQKRQSN